MHGGAAPAVKRNRVQRVELARLRMAGVITEQLTPAEALVAAAQDADHVRQALRQQLTESDDVDPDTLELFGRWLDRTGRLSSSAAEAEPVRARLSQLAADQAVAIIRRVLDRIELTPAQRSRADAEVLAVITEANHTITTKETR